MNWLRCVIAFVGTISVRALGLEPDQIYAKVSPSIVVVVGYRASDPDASAIGSGVVIAPVLAPTEN